MNAQQILALAKQLGIKGTVCKTFRNGQELREYAVPHNGSVQVFAVRAMPVEHA